MPPKAAPVVTPPCVFKRAGVCTQAPNDHVHLDATVICGYCATSHPVGLKRAVERWFAGRNYSDRLKPTFDYLIDQIRYLWAVNYQADANNSYPCAARQWRLHDIDTPPGVFATEMAKAKEEYNKRSRPPVDRPTYLQCDRVWHPNQICGRCVAAKPFNAQVNWTQVLYNENTIYQGLVTAAEQRPSQEGAGGR